MSFFDYKWNNFLHAQLVDIIKNCLSSELKTKTDETETTDENTKNNNDDVAKTADTNSTDTTTTTTTETSPSTFIEHV